MSTKALDHTRALTTLEGKLRCLRRREREKDRLECELNARLDAARSGYAPRVASLQTAVARMREGIEELCRGRRDVLLGGARSLGTREGRVGFRCAPARVVLGESWDAEAACRALERSQLDRLVRIERQLDKSAVRAALARGEVSDETLAGCGVLVVEGAERFFCITDQSEDRTQR